MVIGMITASWTWWSFHVAYCQVQVIQPFTSVDLRSISRWMKRRNVVVIWSEWCLIIIKAPSLFKQFCLLCKLSSRFNYSYKHRRDWFVYAKKIYPGNRDGKNSTRNDNQLSWLTRKHFAFKSLRDFGSLIKSLHLINLHWGLCW